MARRRPRWRSRSVAQDTRPSSCQAKPCQTQQFRTRVCARTGGHGMPGQMDGASSSSAHATRALRGFEMPFGECAAVAHHDNWEDEVTGAPC